MSRNDTPSLRDLNERLTKQSYVAGYAPSTEDEKYFKAIFGDNLNVVQWAARMASYYPSERKQMKPKASGDESMNYSDDGYDE